MEELEPCISPSHNKCPCIQLRRDSEECGPGTGPDPKPLGGRDGGTGREGIKEMVVSAQLSPNN